MHYVGSPISKLVVSTASDEVYLAAWADKSAISEEEFEKNLKFAMVGFIEDLIDTVNSHCNNKISALEVVDELDKYAYTCK